MAKLIAPNPDTEQGWIDLADQVVRKARDAAKDADANAVDESLNECAQFIDIRTLQCPKALAEAVLGVQIELSQMSMIDDIKILKGRTKQFDAYLQDIDALSDQAEKAADLISFQSASDVIDDITGIVKDAKALKTRLKDGDTAAVKSGSDAIVAKLQKIQADFEKLSSSA